MPGSKKYGGTIDEPTADPMVNPVAHISNPGFNVLVMLQLKLSLIVYTACYYNTISWPINVVNMNGARIKIPRSLNETMKSWEDPTELPDIGCNMSIMKLLEHVRENLRGKLGIHKISRSYVVRDNTNVPSIVEDPIAPTTAYSAKYDGLHSELIVRNSNNHHNIRG